MADLELNLRSNVACSGEQGTYYVKAFIPLSWHHIRQRHLALPGKPDFADAISVFTQVRDLLPHSLEEKRLMAVSLHRLCFNRRHEGYPQKDVYGARLERVGAYVLASDQAVILDVKQPSEERDIPKEGIGALHADSPISEQLKTVFLPYALVGQPGYRPITQAIEARTRHEGGSLFVALRGDERIVHQSQMPVQGHE